jgi:hypothetical protein
MAFSRNITNLAPLAASPGSTKLDLGCSLCAQPGGRPAAGVRSWQTESVRLKASCMSCCPTAATYTKSAWVHSGRQAASSRTGRDRCCWNPFRALQRHNRSTTHAVCGRQQQVRHYSTTGCAQWSLPSAAGRDPGITDAVDCACMRMVAHQHMHHRYLAYALAWRVARMAWFANSTATAVEEGPCLPHDSSTPCEARMLWGLTHALHAVGLTQSLAQWGLQPELHVSPFSRSCDHGHLYLSRACRSTNTGPQATPGHTCTPAPALAAT